MVRSELSDRFEAIVLRCLAKEPEARYASASELLANLRDETTTAPARRARAHRSIPLLPVTMFSAILLTVVALATNLFGLHDTLFGGHSIRALAVLPLENLSRDPDQEYFADGMTDELITNLAKIAALRVISRVSVMRYKGSRKSLPEIARELRVDGVVLGTIQRAADRVRIHTQLVRAANEKSLWAESYERPLRDALALEADVARAIASEIRIHLTASERDRLASRRTVDPAVTEAYLRGRFHTLRFTREDGLMGIEKLNQAIELDPGYAPAYAALATTYCTGSGTYFEPQTPCRKQRPPA